MKYLMNATLFSVCFLGAMQEETVPSKVPSLRLLSFKAVRKNLHVLGHATDGVVSALEDVIKKEQIATDPFERARLADEFKIVKWRDPAAREVAHYIDSDKSAAQTRQALIELTSLSYVMQNWVRYYCKQ